MASISISRASSMVSSTAGPSINKVTANALLQTSNKYLSTREAMSLIRHPVKGMIAVAAQDMSKGMLIHEIKGRVFDKPTMHTVCLGKDVHVVPKYGAECISHACHPSSNVEIKSITITDGEPCGKVVLSRNVAKGEELAFNYNTTEWEMSSPFKCSCPTCLAKGSESRALVRGFKFLTTKERLAILHACSPYIRSRVDEY